MQTISGDKWTIAGFNAGKYIRGIRNADKQDYARKYLNWILKGRKGHNGPDYPGLSYMAAQAVRMNLDSIYSEAENATA